MAGRDREGCVILVVAVDPPPPQNALTPSLFVAARRTYGASAVENIEVGPLMTGIVILCESLVFDPIAVPFEAAIARVLAEHGHRPERVEVSRIGTSGSASLREAVEHWVTDRGADSTISAQRHSYREAITDVLNNRRLRTLFQPIVSLRTGEIVAHEALSRGPEGHPLEAAEQLLEGARHAGMIREVSDCLAWLASVRARERFADEHQLLFINLDGDEFSPAMSETYDWQSPLLWPLGQTVVELTERDPIRDLGMFVRLRDRARHQGVRFALDDAGAGYAGLATLAVLRPDFIKVDAALTRDCDNDHVKQSIIASLAYLAEQIGAELMVEGIETVAELATVQELGVDLVQGFLLGAPQETPQEHHALFRLRGTAAPRSQRHRKAAVGAE